MLRHYAKCFIPPYPSQQPKEIGNGSPHFVGRKPKLGEVKLLVLSHTADRCWSLDLNPGL